MYIGGMMKLLLLLITLVILTIHPQKAFANRYDDEYAAEKAGQRLADIINAEEEAGREAAKQRYDNEHQSSAGGGGGGGVLLLFTIIATVVLIICKESSTGKTKRKPLSAAESERVDKIVKELMKDYKPWEQNKR